MCQSLAKTGGIFGKKSGFVTIFYEGLAITCVNTYILYAKDNCHSPFIVVC
jgi:ABC-type uncharacterized transport system permease subunit